MKTLKSVIAIVSIAIVGKVCYAGSNFDAEQFRKNAASVVHQMSVQLGMLQLVAHTQLSQMPFYKVAAPLVDKFFDTLPQYTEHCRFGGADPNYSVTRFFSDLSENVGTISEHYARLQQINDPSLSSEKKCLSEHVIQFVVDNRELAETIVSMLSLANKVRDEL